MTKEFYELGKKMFDRIPPIAQPDEACIWTEDDPVNTPDTYASACGELWSFIDGGPADNKVRFCHGCGKPVQTEEAK